MYPWGDFHSLNLGWFLVQFKEWVDKIQEYLDNGGGTSENLANVIAPVFNAENSYLTGDYVLYNDELYKANQAVNPGTWNPDAWTRCLVTEEMGSGSGGVDNVARLMIAGQYSNTYNYQKYAICRYSDKLWMCNTNLPAGGEEWVPSHWDEITVGAGLTGLRRSVDTLAASISDLQNDIIADPSNRLKGKKIAIYGDSWASEANGSLGKSYIESVTGETVHVVGLGSHTMQTIYNDGWDSYNADIYIIEGGLNDKSTGVGATAFINAINSWLTAIRGVNSSAEIYFITPPSIKTSNQYQALFPLEFYRIIIWGLAPWRRYGVINALKWTNISFNADNVHPLITSADQIGKYVVNALINYGDEETHIPEFTNLNRADNQLLLKCNNGNINLVTQNFSVTAADDSNYFESIQLGTTFSNVNSPFVNGSTGVAGLFVYDVASPNTLRFYQYNVGTGNRITSNGASFPLEIRDLQLPTVVP